MKKLIIALAISSAFIALPAAAAMSQSDLVGVHTGFMKVADATKAKPAAKPAKAKAPAKKAAKAKPKAKAEKKS